MLTIRIHNLTGVLLVGAYVIQGGIDQRGLDRMLIPAAVLLLLYLPVAFAQLRPRKAERRSGPLGGREEGARKPS